ncbi:MAG: cytidylate kinase-like family protein [Rikenellaceae bacterium]|nr:cytidylate kinase-like family protein [Rikenellaceae bacterium]
MNPNFVIAVGRQFGSGGREIGKQLAARFGIGYYDKELMKLAAKESGVTEEFFEKADERTPGTLMHALSVALTMGGGAFQSNALSGENLFRFQSEVIRQLAAEQSCVIVGRTADYILRANPRCVNIFVHAPMEVRVGRIATLQDLSPRKAEELIRKTDKSRAAYYNYYTGKTWGDSASYHLSVDSSALGIDTTTGYIEQFVASRLASVDRNR